MARHRWTKDDIRVVFATCKANTNKKDRVRILQSYFPDCSIGALKFQILRFQKRNDDTLKWIPSVPLDRNWDDKQLCEYFELTEEEKKLIK